MEWLWQTRSRELTDGRVYQRIKHGVTYTRCHGSCCQYPLPNPLSGHGRHRVRMVESSRPRPLYLSTPSFCPLRALTTSLMFKAGHPLCWIHDTDLVFVKQNVYEVTYYKKKICQNLVLGWVFQDGHRWLLYSVERNRTGCQYGLSKNYPNYLNITVNK